MQGYLTSRAAFNELDALEGFVSHFSSEEIDLLQRIPAGADREAQYRTYERRVKVGFDPTEGIVRMQVQAADPETSRDMSLQLIALAETHLDEMTAQLRADQVATAQAAKDRADAAVAKAQSELVDLQEGLSVLSGDLEMSLLQEQIGETQSKLSSARIEREELLANRRPNETRLAAADLRIRLLGDELTDQRAQITQASSGGMSMARAQGELAVLQAELASLQQVQTQNVIALEQARLEAGRQVRYLSLGVEPVLPGAPEFPRPFIHTLMAFGAILGIYLLAALTVSLIREQILEG